MLLLLRHLMYFAFDDGGYCPAAMERQARSKQAVHASRAQKKAAGGNSYLSCFSSKQTPSQPVQTHSAASAARPPSVRAAS